MVEVLVLMRLLLAAAGADAESLGGAALVLALAGLSGLLAYVAVSLLLRNEEALRLVGRLGR